MTVAERVADGVAMLDEHNPGWWDGVDLETFEISIATCCILGHVYGAYSEGVRVLSGREAGVSDWEQAHGFTIEELDEPWAPIQAGRVRVIEARQAADPVLASEFVEEVALD